MQDLVNPKYYKYFYQVNVNTGGEYVINFNNFAIQSLHVNLNYLKCDFKELEIGLNNGTFTYLFISDTNHISKSVGSLAYLLGKRNKSAENSSMPSQSQQESGLQVDLKKAQ